MKRPQPLPTSESKLPAYESLPDTVRRIVREELSWVLDGIEEIQASLGTAAVQEGSLKSGV